MGFEGLLTSQGSALVGGGRISDELIGMCVGFFLFLIWFICIVFSLRINVPAEKELCGSRTVAITLFTVSEEEANRPAPAVFLVGPGRSFAADL